ncbi:MAG TPA: hypothetical protein DEP84_34845 [Chloroflexi bacterium]|nr:hypothetical protein [Chloroflexota bacterium]
MTHEGAAPVRYPVVPGNTADSTRPLPHLRARVRFLSRPELAERRLRPLLVSDCKMVTPEAVAACHRHDLSYLGPLANGTAVDQLLRSVSGMELTRHLLSYRPQRVKAGDDRCEPYQGVRRPCTFVHDGQVFEDRVLVV